MELGNIMLYRKNSETGFLENEIGIFNFQEKSKYISKVYLENIEGKDFLTIWLTLDKEILNWEFEAIADCYEEEKLEALGAKVVFLEEEYSPTWEMKIDSPEGFADIESLLEKVIEVHENELLETLEYISDKEEEYKE